MGVLDSLFFINLGCSEVADVGVTVDVAMVMKMNVKLRRQTTAYLAMIALWQHNNNTICACVINNVSRAAHCPTSPQAWHIEDRHHMHRGKIRCVPKRPQHLSVPFSRGKMPMPTDDLQFSLYHLAFTKMRVTSTTTRRLLF